MFGQTSSRNDAAGGNKSSGPDTTRRLKSLIQISLSFPPKNRHKIAVKEGIKMPTGKQGFSPEEMKELFNIDLTSFRALWEAKQQEEKEGAKEGLKESKALLKEKKFQVKALVNKVGDFFKDLGRKVKEEVSKLRKRVAGWRKGGRKDVPLLKKAKEEL